jgi:hypothetical protein
MNPVHQRWPLSQSRYSPCRHRHPALPQPNVELQLVRQIRLLVNAACAARVSAAQMTLCDWRDVEQEVKRRLENED